MMIFMALKDYLNFLLDLLSGKRYRAEQDAADMRQRDCKAIFLADKKLTVLDLANGSLRPQSQILSNSGHTVVGIDLVNIPMVSFKSVLYAVARFLYSLRLPRNAARAKPLYLASDVGKIPLKDDSIDLVTSIAAFEHFLDVPTVLAECRRVLKKDGYIWASIHIFSCLSGGHNIHRSLNPLQSLPKNIEPWDHLRKRKLSFSVSLNEWRKEQYVKEFSKHFEITKIECLGREGETLLTNAIKEELSDYTVDELTCAALLIVGRKKL